MLKITVENKVFSVGHKYINKNLTKDKTKKGREGGRKNQDLIYAKEILKCLRKI